MNSLRTYTNRRRFLRGAAGFGASAVTGFGLSAGILPLLNACGGGAGSAAPTIPLPTFPPGREPPPETTKIRLGFSQSLCITPEVYAETFLREEGFTDISYVEVGGYEGTVKGLTTGELDLGQAFVGSVLLAIDQGNPLVMLGGVHVACFELFASARVNSLRDFKGKSLYWPLDPTEPQGPLLSTIFSYIGLNPNKDINWVHLPVRIGMEALRIGQIDGLLALPPISSEMRDRQIGRVILDSHHDQPWSSYFCCYVTSTQDYIAKNPVATKRALRAIMKAADVCAADPLRAARFMADRQVGILNLDYAEDAMKKIDFSSWRTYSQEDTIRFNVLRLKETGVVKKLNPETVLARNTDWRFLNQVKQELKA